ncbi:hypothetical protein HX021_03135 [Sphingobacterium sp. N143]|uniref:hypothetical protein n=1 Tax=Sphingobacterium sp. N143 TaxID=2746727 RepID=UPI00257664CC|nr:hypothetical protein [Sphingobacterium sp. N143]MDM1293285.1 hypothetical protein [Sphingobacterium sp. N143]
MKKRMKLIGMFNLGLLASTLVFSCGNSTKNPAEGSGQSNNIAPSDADETRYNLSQQQKMSMQKDTTLLDTIQHDSLEDID